MAVAMLVSFVDMRSCHPGSRLADCNSMLRAAHRPLGEMKAGSSQTLAVMSAESALITAPAPSCESPRRAASDVYSWLAGIMPRPLSQPYFQLPGLPLIFMRGSALIVTMVSRSLVIEAQLVSGRLGSP